MQLQTDANMPCNCPKLRPTPHLEKRLSLLMQLRIQHPERGLIERLPWRCSIRRREPRWRGGAATTSDNRGWRNLMILKSLSCFPQLPSLTAIGCGVALRRRTLSPQAPPPLHERSAEHSQLGQAALRRTLLDVLLAPSNLPQAVVRQSNRLTKQQRLLPSSIATGFAQGIAHGQPRIPSDHGKVRW